MKTVVSNPVLTEASLNDAQRQTFDLYVDRINNIIEANEAFRMEIAEQIVALKENLFGGKFELGGYEERFVILGIAKRVGFDPNSLSNWVKVYLTFLSVDHTGLAYQDLGFNEKLMIVNRIKVHKKKPTEAIKEYYTDKADPIKKTIFYLERYLRQTLSSARALEEIKRPLSEAQKVSLSEYKTKLKITVEILDRLLAL
jgi:hypothetical protein